MTSWEFSKPSWLPQPAHFSLMKHISSHFPHTQSIFCFYHHYLLSPTSSASVLFLLKGSLATQFKLAFNSPCSLRWPQLTVNPSASASWVLGLQVWVTMFFFKLQSQKKINACTLWDKNSTSKNLSDGYTSICRKSKTKMKHTYKMFKRILFVIPETMNVLINRLVRKQHPK